ncbi:RNA helicase [Coprinopsis cinerea okayama7|uniref:RNA helicase n=1 Tax=Coprinopsis cinerea (strain Okayama-7 / 130 / ATCC MYA-4618 / FGSC 9003) TaxID=240176 RepID=A8NLC6_COPC7|nr:RNA helicase [Coprinopsis cinerea okayama7\|eukprot:XP_001834653.1 RNA helicase [Coprinopsis cinerea okayama7\
MASLPSRLRIVCLQSPAELQAATCIRALHSTSVQQRARFGLKDTGSASQPPVSGRRKLVDLKELEPRSRTGRLEVARERQRPSEREDEPSTSGPFYKPKEQLDYNSTSTSPEFETPPSLVSTGSSMGITNSLRDLPKSFSSPPLLPGLTESIHDILGEGAKPTPIQALSLKWVLDYCKDEERAFEHGQWLLASETGSGKSFAYLLPLLQAVKEAELRGEPLNVDPDRPLNPRAIILAPTHELSRQISSFAKSLLHKVKLRVVCASQNNSDLKSTRNVSSRDMAADLDSRIEFDSGKEGPQSHPVDILVGTPMKIMDMVRGRWWDLKGGELGGTGRELDRGNGPRRNKTVGKPELGLANVEWVIIDEADVLLDPDFQEVTRALLADISEARGHPVQLDPFPFSAASVALPAKAETSPKLPGVKAKSNPNAIEYPFNLLLTSATIPSSMSRYLDLYHPRLLRLASPRLHKLPETLKMEYVKWTGGNRFVDVERRAREVWAVDAIEAGSRRDIKNTEKKPELSKILIFCNKSSKVQELSDYLEEKGIKNVAVTSGKEAKRRRNDDSGAGVRTRGSNKYLEGFLRPIGSRRRTPSAEQSPSPSTTPSNPYMLSDPSTNPHVLITTSLLSRGLDFDPSIKHVFIVDEPRNMVDFLHRAGRSGRMGGLGGKVVVFGRSGVVDRDRRGGGKGSGFEGKGALLGKSLGGAIVSKKVLSRFSSERK